VTERNHTLNILLIEAMPVDVVLAELTRKWFLLKIHLEIMEELLSLMGG